VTLRLAERLKVTLQLRDIDNEFVEIVATHYAATVYALRIASCEGDVNRRENPTEMLQWQSDAVAAKTEKDDKSL